MMKINPNGYQNNEQFVQPVQEKQLLPKLNAARPVQASEHPVNSSDQLNIAPPSSHPETLTDISFLDEETHAHEHDHEHDHDHDDDYSSEDHQRQLQFHAANYSRAIQKPEAIEFSLSEPINTSKKFITGLKAKNRFKKDRLKAKRYDLNIRDHKIKIYEMRTRPENQVEITALAEALARLPEGVYSQIDKVIMEPILKPTNEKASMSASFKSNRVRVFPRAQTRDELYTTLLHETGHLISGDLWGRNPFESEWMPWNVAIANDGKSVSKYGDKNPKEDFAEAFVAYYTTLGTQQHEVMWRHFPNRFAIIKDLELNQDNKIELKALALHHESEELVELAETTDFSSLESDDIVDIASRLMDGDTDEDSEDAIVLLLNKASDEQFLEIVLEPILIERFIDELDEEDIQLIVKRLNHLNIEPIPLQYMDEID